MNWYANACTCNSFSDGSIYSLFVGLNDTCGNQRLPTEQAMIFIQEVCACYFTNGYTILKGVGADRGSSHKIETTVYIMAIEADEKTVFQVVEVLQKKFNQSEILVEKNPTQYMYVSR